MDHMAPYTPSCQTYSLFDQQHKKRKKTQTNEQKPKQAKNLLSNNQLNLINFSQAKKIFMGCVERDRLVLFCFLPAQCAEFAPKKKSKSVGVTEKRSTGSRNSTKPGRTMTPPPPHLQQQQVAIWIQLHHETKALKDSTLLN